MEKNNIRSKRSTNIKTSIKFDNNDLDEYKHDVEQSITRRLYSPQVESLARKKPSLTKDDFVPREGQVSIGKLYDPYTDQMINSWQETSFGQQLRRTENYEMKSSKHSRANSANEALMTKSTTNDSNRRKDVKRKEVTNQDPKLEALKLLTKELVQLEKKVSEASIQFNKGMNGDNSDSIIKTCDENFWQEKISLHLSLANKYFEHIHLNYHSSVKKDIETKCWKFGFYSLIDQFRQAINLDRHRSKNRSSLSLVTLNKFNIFLNEAELFYKRLLKQIANDTKSNKSIEKNKPPRWIRCVSCLGDITRYRWNYGIGDHEKAKEFWAVSASRWYRLGIHLNSNNGKFYNHLAILAGQDELRTLYYYCRSLMVNTPFMNARESLIALFESNRQLVVGSVKQNPKGNRGYLQKDNLKTRNLLDNQSIESLFVRLHGMLFTKIGLERFDENFQIFLDKLFKMSAIQSTDSNKCWIEFYLFLAVINLSSLYNYGNNEKSTIGQAIKLQTIKNANDMELLDVDPAFAQESKITFIIMNQFMLKYLESDICQDEPDVSEGWLLYCEIILLWIVASGIFNNLTEAGNSVWRSVIQKLILPGTWGILARFITKIAHQITPLTKERILDSVNSDPEHRSIQIQPPPLTEDWELRGISLLQSIYQHNLFESASKLNINFVDTDVEDIINISNDVECNFSLDQDEKIRRRVRIMELGYILTKKVNGFDFDIKEESFTASSELNKNMESDEVNDIVHQTLELSIEEDDNAILKTTESTFEEYSEDDDEGIMELKSRRQELETLLAVSRNDVHNYKTARFSSKKSRKVKRTASEKKESSVLCRVAPGYTTIVVDTNYLIGDLEMVKKLIQSEKWIIVVPLVVITELDGLKLNPSPLGHAAYEALIYLKEIISSINKSKKIKIQTSKGNYLPNINFSEEFDFGDGEDKKKNLDDLILGICLWHAKHHENHGTRDKSNEERNNNDYKNEIVVLLTNDRNLRVKARARGVDVVGVNDFTGLI
ncbi:12765_t:CDS:2 [Funneliformis caledonium]|uniref:12765_t:CDS:1 n=1 Tax=Funneliformis caledonium TaxID=1117310 RepID=A0A9N9F2X1_9GLOM|nr:12765_t:CDS:2 [Funneliformis caledonium]